jgi:hypothetical protein
MSLEQQYNEAVTKEDKKWLFKMFLKVVGGILVLSAFFSLIGFACGWYNTGKEIISPANVKAQYALAYDDYEAMGAMAKQACRVDKALATATTDAEKSQRTTQLLAIENNYDRVAGEYNARIDDLFRAKIVRPRDLPADAPSLEDRKAEVC